jgi:hypothetical protein
MPVAHQNIFINRRVIPHHGGRIRRAGISR